MQWKLTELHKMFTTLSFRHKTRAKDVAAGYFADAIFLTETSSLTRAHYKPNLPSFGHPRSHPPSGPNHFHSPLSLCMWRRRLRAIVFSIAPQFTLSLSNFQKSTRSRTCCASLSLTHLESVCSPRCQDVLRRGLCLEQQERERERQTERESWKSSIVIYSSFNSKHWNTFCKIILDKIPWRLQSI